jgi:hypothetical protein
MVIFNSYVKLPEGNTRNNTSLQPKTPFAAHAHSQNALIPAGDHLSSAHGKLQWIACGEENMTIARNLILPHQTLSTDPVLRPDCNMEDSLSSNVKREIVENTAYNTQCFLLSDSEFSGF